VMPPKKSWKNISNLSGGEKFFDFGIRMDETDAALDFRNVSIVANIIKERIYKIHDQTKSVTIDSHEIGK
ncbi:12893_t:CDS:2, partial [Funneliformis caledonium]